MKIDNFYEIEIIWVSLMPSRAALVKSVLNINFWKCKIKFGPVIFYYVGINYKSNRSFYNRTWKPFLKISHTNATVNRWCQNTNSSAVDTPNKYLYKSLPMRSAPLSYFTSYIGFQVRVFLLIVVYTAIILCIFFNTFTIRKQIISKPCVLI